MEKVFDSILSWEGGSGSKKYLVSPRSVFDFFTVGIHLLRIPDYQRPYSWSKKNILDLLYDVQKLSLKQNNSSWFLGPIFTVKKSTEDQFSDLLDGQQRVTTIQIILREASLILFEEDGIDLSEFPELDKKIKKAINASKQCLVRLNGFDEIPVFETEEQLKNVFRSYILEFNDIESYDDLKKKRINFTDKVNKIRIEGSISAGTILESIKIIRKFLKDNFIKNEKNIDVNFNKFYDFIDALINKCWLIEIPLQDHNDSIQIFESLNNRGKSLTLVDKLRYKSIISSSHEAVSEVRGKWKNVYSGLNFLIDENYVKNEDDFFKVFFNSINGDDITKEEDFIDLFSNSFLNGDKYIISFLEQTIHIFEFFRILSSSLDSKNSFITNYFEKHEQDKVKALLQLLKQALSISDNSRFLLFYALRKLSNYKEDNYVLVQTIWNIIRYVYYDEVYKSLKSNIVRTDYLELIKSIESGSRKINDSSVISTFSHNKSLNNLLKTLNNSEAKFVIYLYTYLNNYSSLISHSPNQYQKSHLDHLFPRAWKSEWKDKNYKQKEILDFIKELKVEEPNLFKNISFDQFYLDIENSENFELLTYTTSPVRQLDSLIEFIGNKWVLHAGTNIKTSNNNFEFKKLEYEDEKWVKIPANSDDLGLNKYDEFTYKEIIVRSLKLANGIISKIQNPWDQI